MAKGKIIETDHWDKSNLCPILIVLFGLSDSARADSFRENISGFLAPEGAVAEFPVLRSQEYRLRATFLSAPQGDLLSCMEMGKVADVVAFITSAREEISQFGSECLAMFSALGFPSTYLLIQDQPHDLTTNKLRNNLSSLFKKLPDDCPSFRDDELHKFMWHLKECKLEIPNWRMDRPYMMAREMELGENGDLILSGYLRAHSLSMNQKVHVSGAGHFEIRRVDFLTDPHPYNVQQGGEAQDVQVLRSLRHTQDFVENDPDFSDNDPDFADNDPDFAENDPDFADNDPDFAENDPDFAENDPDFADNDPDEVVEDNFTEGHLEDNAGVVHAEDLGNDAEDVHAHEVVHSQRRYAKYRCISSSSWNYNESPPPQGSDALYWEDFSLPLEGVQQELKKKQGRENHWIPVGEGTYTRMYIMGVPPDVIPKLTNPIVACVVLMNEEKITLQHFRVKKHEEYKDDIKAKEELVVHIGFRQFVIRPIYSKQFGQGKWKSLKFLPEEFGYASFYAPINFSSPTPLVALKRQEDGSSPSFVAFGWLSSTDPDKQILKELTLTGVVVEVLGSKAWVEEMFQYRDDVIAFMNMEVWTQNGARGLISSARGTNGMMTCIFEGTVNPEDDVYIKLYKLVFPKWPGRFYPLEPPLPGPP